VKQVIQNGELVYEGTEKNARVVAGQLVRQAVSRYPDPKRRDVGMMIASWVERGVISGARPFLIDADHPELPEWGEWHSAPRVVVLVQDGESS
jgi:hypothetical protein